MAQETYRANLHSNDFPFFSRNMGETVILQKYDHTYARALAPNSENTKDAGIPQAYYMHNVLPTEYGFQSVSYRQIAAAAGGIPQKGSAVHVIHDPTSAAKKYVHLAYPSGGGGVDGSVLYVFSPSIYGTSSPYTATGLTLATKNTSFAYIQELNYYLSFVANSINEINFSTLVVTPRALGLPGITFSGICASQGYLIGWYLNKVYWGSLTTPYDFAPNQVTGAGGASVNGIIGPIIKCIPALNGFVVLGSKNAVFASYTGNVRYPFTFNEIKNSGGSPGALATEDGNSGLAYVLSTVGLQAISGAIAETVVPDLQALTTNYIYEDFNLNTNEFVWTTLNPSQPFSNFFYTIKFIGNRYLCISYGKDIVELYSAPPPTLLDYYAAFDFILVYDTVLLRWGKLKKRHVCTFTYTNFNYGNALGADTIGLIDPDGNGWVVDLALGRAADTDSVLILGKYQRDRDSMLNLQEVNAQYVEVGASFELGTYYTLDGRTKAGYVPGYLATVKEGVRKYNFDVNAYNHSLVLKGDFHVNTLNLIYTNGGSV